MSFAAALFLAAAAVTSAPAPQAGPRAGEVLASAQVQVAILEPAIVRQDGGLQQDSRAPRPQVSRAGRQVFYEYQ